MKVTVDLHLPEHFLEACETLGVDDEVALQTFIDRVIIFSYLSEPYEAPESLASNIFSHSINYNKKSSEKSEVQRKLHMDYIQKVLKLVVTNMDLTRKEKAYRKLIDKWYIELTNTQQP
jgi:hypothetical protein